MPEGVAPSRPGRTRMTICLALALGLIGSLALAGDEPPDFDRDVRPIFENRCLPCHGHDARKGGLLLTARHEAFLATDSGEPALVPGDPEASELLFRVEAADELDRMPPSGAPLSTREIEVLRAWIADGAPWPERGLARAAHWAYVAPECPDLPDVSDPGWCRNPIDRFILARLDVEGVSPAREADRATLIRRLSLDLIGIPPTVEEVDAFLADDRSDAYDRLVNRLLASPRYGERWATPWLDLARFADSNGFQRDGFRDVWPYRDYVIGALNADLPFDRFTIEQIAGDLLPGATVDQRIATGFLRGNAVNVEAGVDQEENRINGIVDRVNTVATVWLGSTIACAQCHNHKYDPITQREYYELFAYFNNTPIETMFRRAGNTSEIDFIGPSMELPTPADVVSLRETLTAQRAEFAGRWGSARRSWEDRVCADEATVPPPLREIFECPEAERSDAQRAIIDAHFLADHPGMADVRKALSELDEKLEALAPVRSLVMVEMDEPRSTFVLKRGNFLDPGAQVSPGVPAVLHPLPEDAAPDRFGLARWLVEPNNPLMTRVTVNRWWQSFFGRGLVTTPEDFGIQGSWPSHPELLDWLAVEFLRSGWSTKNVHRLIVSSATYRQASSVTSERRERDPENSLFARGARFRLDAEAIRDNALFASGLLTERLGGPPVFPPQPEDIWRVTGQVDNSYHTSDGPDRYRRGLYTIWRRSAPYPSFVAFDATDRSQCLVERSRTNSPLQALTLLNDPVAIEMARALADRVAVECPDSELDARISHAFRLCLARAPTESERASVRLVHQRMFERFREDPAAAEEFIGGETVDPADRAAWIGVANVLLNLDEMITRE